MMKISEKSFTENNQGIIGNSGARIKLIENWQMQSSEKINASIEDICNANFKVYNWHKVSIPSTVLGALIKNGIIKDPYFGLNLRRIAEEPFKVPWLFRKQFSVRSQTIAQIVLLLFEGINYSANIWINGKKIGDSIEVKGAFRQFKFDITEYIHWGENVLLVEVFPPQPGDFSTGFVDWNPAPPDRNMGIFRDVTLHFCENVSIDYPFVVAHLKPDQWDKADLDISAELTNHSKYNVSGMLVGQISDIIFQKSVNLQPYQQKTVRFTSVNFPDLVFRDPKLWWPNNLGDPNLYHLNLEFRIQDNLLDRAAVRFGIRLVEDYVNKWGHRGFKINGQKILIKSAGWTDDLFLSDTVESLEAQIKYVMHMNLNSIRLEGIWGKDHTLYDLCDENGILVMVGWSCHWEHEQYLGKSVNNRFGGVFSQGDIDLISKSWEDQVKWLRHHPSIFVWTVASDKVPHPDLERSYQKTFKNFDPTRPYLNSTGGLGSEQGIITDHLICSDISGSSRVKMLGPYAYTPPVYWFTDKNLGGAYGFNTETGPGAQPPVAESIRKMIPSDSLWPIDEVWNFHCGRNEFNTLDCFQTALTKRYGEVRSIEEFDLKAQTMNYELMRPMFEAFRANKGKATGIVQWMLNSAWPKMYWQLYDHFLVPNGAFYSTRKACEPLQLIFNYGNNSVYLVNDFLFGIESYSARIRLYDQNSEINLEQNKKVSAPANSVVKIYRIRESGNRSPISFLDLRLYDEKDTEVTHNFYWLSDVKDVLDYQIKVEPWPYYTPSKQYADFRELDNLNKSTISVEINNLHSSDSDHMELNVSNHSPFIAFFIRFDLIFKETQDLVIPIFWSDNYISLLPGENRILSAKFNNLQEKLLLSWKGWNIKKEQRSL
jgi:exo-1,4-beta-D-glucosaminidase